MLVSLNIEFKEKEKISYQKQCAELLRLHADMLDCKDDIPQSGSQHEPEGDISWRVLKESANAAVRMVWEDMPFSMANFSINGGKDKSAKLLCRLISLQFFRIMEYV